MAAVFSNTILICRPTVKYFSVKNLHTMTDNISLIEDLVQGKLFISRLRMDSFIWESFPQVHTI